MVNLSGFILPIRVVQVVFAIIVLGLAGYVDSAISLFGSLDRVNFMIFNAVWTLLAVAYLVLAPMFMPKIAHKFAMLAVDALTCLLWFAGFIALAVFISAFRDFTGDFNGHWSGAASAASAFGAFEWLLFVASSVITGLDGGVASTPSTTPAAPAMQGV